MSRISGHVVIARPMDEVFDYVADQRNEPDYNDRMTRVEKLTEGPIGVGTRFRATAGRFPFGTDIEVETTGFDRPRYLASWTTLRSADIEGHLTLAAVGGGTELVWSWHLRPHGPARLLGPLVGWLGNREERRIWGALKSHLEAHSDAPPTAEAAGPASS